MSKIERIVLQDIVLQDKAKPISHFRHVVKAGDHVRVSAPARPGLKVEIEAQAYLGSQWV